MRLKKAIHHRSNKYVDQTVLGYYHSNTEACPPSNFSFQIKGTDLRSFTPAIASRGRRASIVAARCGRNVLFITRKECYDLTKIKNFNLTPSSSKETVCLHNYSRFVWSQCLSFMIIGSHTGRRRVSRDNGAGALCALT
ncbi:hypothetical protein EVAR_96598_1 [Eumeta japonica]|uniref:Uncharacterized protein n=1 Tax=Eumeta variegata TaxID=151549 RepID=A0A4C1WSV6_EUMVA|nr:hypothetical protein EVAR_96598_1 [Eumeta japonica]